MALKTLLGWKLSIELEMALETVCWAENGSRNCVLPWKWTGNCVLGWKWLWKLCAALEMTWNTSPQNLEISLGTKTHSLIPIDCVRG